MIRDNRTEEADGVYIDLRQASDFSFNTKDGGQTGWVAAWDSRKPVEGDYLLIPYEKRNPQEGMTRYKVTESNWCMNVDPANMFTASVRHAPSSRP